MKEMSHSGASGIPGPGLSRAEPLGSRERDTGSRPLRLRCLLFQIADHVLRSTG
jgi:hypothetical protein